VTEGSWRAAEQGPHAASCALRSRSSYTSPAGELSAAQKLVLQDHVYAVIASSVLLFSAAKFLADHGIPVFGPGADGDEWITTLTMFSIIGYQDYTKVYTMFGDFLKEKGVTSLGSVGYGIEPSSKENAEENAASAKHAGIKVGYLNTAFPLGSTNVGPLVLAMKAAGIDGLATSIVTNSSFAIVNGLKQQGLNLKVNRCRPATAVTSLGAVRARSAPPGAAISSASPWPIGGPLAASTTASGSSSTWAPP
jgi:ABC-type branched-subunit amino acid transport system substrate-binding protein